MKAFVRGFVIVAVALWLDGCGADDQELDVDAGPDAAADLDAAACPAPLTVEQRDLECKAMCAMPDVVCAGAASGACWTECMGYARGTAYCPEP